MKVPKLLKYVLAGFAGILLVGSLLSTISNHNKRVLAETQAGTVLILNENMKGQVARLNSELDSLKALREAEKKLGGDAVAGVKIVVPGGVDTVYVDSSKTEVKPDGSRKLVGKDSLRYGITLTYEVQVAAFPEPINFGYIVDYPDFEPEVGFIKVGDSYTAVVSWEGVNFEVQNAFFVPPKEKPLTLYARGEAFLTPNEDASLGADVSLRPSLVLDYKVSDRWSTYILSSYTGKLSFGTGVSFRILSL